MRKKQKKEWDGGIPNWAWYITWGVMIAAIVIEIIGIVGILKR